MRTGGGGDEGVIPFLPFLLFCTAELPPETCPEKSVDGWIVT